MPKTETPKTDRLDVIPKADLGSAIRPHAESFKKAGFIHGLYAREPEGCALIQFIEIIGSFNLASLCPQPEDRAYIAFSTPEELETALKTCIPKGVRPSAHLMRVQMN